MAKIILGQDSQELDPGYIMEACEDLGVPFGCRAGACGTCEIRIVSGMEYLNPLTESEDDMGLDEGCRLACQCIIGQGDVKIDV